MLPCKGTGHSGRPRGDCRTNIGLHVFLRRFTALRLDPNRAISRYNGVESAGRSVSFDYWRRLNDSNSKMDGNFTESDVFGRV